MPPIDRNRDCIILTKGATFPVHFDAAMVAQGWVGGQGFKYTTPIGLGLPTVTFADGIGSGFVLYGSDESGDNFTALTRNQTQYRFGTGGLGGWVISTVAYEKYTYLSRQGPGPLIPLSYAESSLLYFSLRGYFTVEDEWTLSGDPRAPNTNIVATVCQEPTGNHLTLQVFL